MISLLPKKFKISKIIFYIHKFLEEKLSLLVVEEKYITLITGKKIKIWLQKTEIEILNEEFHKLYASSNGPR